MDRRRTQRGSALILVLISSIILVAMVGSLALLSQKETETVQDVRELEQARLVTEAGLNLVVEDYQQDQAAPPSSWYSSPQALGNGDFQIVTDNDLGVPTQRRYVQLFGSYGSASWRLEGIIGPEIKAIFDAAIQANGDILLRNNPLVDSWDSRIPPGWYSAAAPKEHGDIKGNGDIDLQNNSDVLGEIEVAGVATVSGSSTVTGDVTGDGDGPYLPPVDGLVNAMDATLSAANDNLTIPPAILDMSSGNPAINVPVGQTHVLPAGDYYLNDVEVSQNGGLYFDTTGGPIRIVVHTADYLIGRNGFTYVLGANPVHIYLTGGNSYRMENLSFQWTFNGQAQYHQVVAHSTCTDPAFTMGQNTHYEGTIWAPEADVQLAQRANVYGAIIGEDVNVEMYSSVHYDEALMDWVQILVPDSYRIYYKRRVVTG